VSSPLSLGVKTALITSVTGLLGLLDVAPGQLSQRGRVFLATELNARACRSASTRSRICVRRGSYGRSSSRCCAAVRSAQSLAAYSLFLLHERTP